MPPYSYRTPPSGRYFYDAPPPLHQHQQHSGIHFSDWQTAMPVPDNFYVQTWVASPAYGAYGTYGGPRSPGRSPSMSPNLNDDRTDWPIREELRRSGRGNCAAESPERGRKDEGSSRDAGAGDREGDKSSNKGKEKISSKNDEKSSEKSDSKTGRKGGEKGDGKTTGKEIVKAVPVRTDPKAAQRREQKLVEVRLLLSQLRDQLSTAYYVHKEAFDAFNSHITSELKQFADEQTLVKLWIDKLRADAKKNEGKRPRDRPVDFGTATAQVSLCLKHLESACEKKLPAVPGSETKDAVVDNQTRIVIAAVKEALSWAENAGENYQACEETVHYLDRAFNITDTQGQLWKALLDIPAASLAPRAFD